MPTYRRDLTRDLTPDEVDDNFLELRAAIDDILANPPQANDILSIAEAPLGMDITTRDGATTFIALPVLQFRWRSEGYVVGAAYDALDAFAITGVGVYSVLQDHTAADLFDENRLIGGQPVYNKLFAADVGAVTAASQIYDVGTFFQGKLSDSTEDHLWEIPIVRRLTLPIAFDAGHEAHIKEAPSSVDQICTIYHNTTAIGSVTFSVGSNFGNFAFTITADEDLEPGDVLALGKPVSADPVAGGAGVVFACLRVIA